MTATLLGAKRLRELLDAHDIHPSKALGQNFVIDPNTIRKMVEVAGVVEGDVVLEIGAGAGSLTLGLVAAGANVTAVELDRRLLPVIEEVTAELPSVSVVHADAVTFDYGSVVASSMVANLPYNIATQVVLRALEEGPDLKRLTVMTQREVGERLAASPGSKVYGLTTVLLAYFAHARVAARVSR
ncbi:MAG: ribosomal RNA small subunit methyltransferase A, partial [Actinomycetota bacterium]